MSKTIEMLQSEVSTLLPNCLVIPSFLLSLLLLLLASTLISTGAAMVVAVRSGAALSQLRRVLLFGPVIENENKQLSVRISKQPKHV